jgi:hypothetical protein
MTRVILLVLCWLVAAFALWVLLVSLEVYWNLYDWQPKVDAIALGLGLAIFSTIACIWLLTRASRRLAARGTSLLICLALLILGVYVLPPEPKGSGLFARERTSPFWYRGGRLAVLALPALFWVLSTFRQNNTAGAYPNGGRATLSGNSGVTEGPPSAR